MNDITILNYEANGIRFDRRGSLVFANLNDMAAIAGKRLDNWQRLESTKTFLGALKHSLGCEVMVSNVGGKPETTGTWGIEEVALDFAAWCSVELKIWMYQQIKVLLSTGKVELQPEPIKLPPSDIRVTNLVSALEKLGLDFGNPRFKQGYQDLIHDVLGIGTPQLKGTKEIWQGVAERAEELGYPVALVVKHRSQLGIWVKSHKLESKMEKRLCNGTERAINLYSQSKDFDDAIKEFMDMKVLAS